MKSVKTSRVGRRTQLFILLTGFEPEIPLIGNFAGGHIATIPPVWWIFLKYSPMHIEYELRMLGSEQTQEIVRKKSLEITVFLLQWLPLYSAIFFLSRGTWELYLRFRLRMKQEIFVWLMNTKLSASLCEIRAATRIFPTGLFEFHYVGSCLGR